jgi:hypothetical protein
MTGRVDASVGGDPEPKEALTALRNELQEEDEASRVDKLLFHAVSGIHTVLHNIERQQQWQTWMIGAGLAIISIITGIGVFT